MTPRAPRLDPRRTAQFAAELRERAAAWLPSWDLTEGEGDFGRALLDIAARFSSEVAERFDDAGEKMRRGFLDWLAVRGEAARPARMPVVFKLVDAAPGPVLAAAPVRMQADANGIAVVFETETDVRVVPGQIAMVVAADADRDAFFLSPPGLSDLKPLEPLPTEWQLQSFASIGATRLQLDPELGLVPGMIVAAGGQQYRIVEADKDLVTIEPPLGAELPAGTRVSKVTTFAPFDGTARNWQTHALYLGDAELLNIEAAATLVVEGAAALEGGITWQYWGKRGDQDAVGWQTLEKAADDQQPDNGGLALVKPQGAVEPREIGGRSSRWVRAFTQTLGPSAEPFTIDEFRLRLNVAGCDEVKCPPETPTTPPAAEGMANTTPLVLENVFFPLGKDPKQFDAFYLGSQEAFSKKGAQVQLCFEVADPTFLALAAAREGVFANQVLAGVARDRALHLLAIDATTGGITKFRKREALRPPLPALDGAPVSGGPVVLDEPQPWRLPVWSPDQGFVVAASAGDEIWLWREKPADNEADQSGWSSFGTIPVSAAAEPPPISGLVNLTDGTKSQLVVLRDHQMAVRRWPDGAQWTPVPTEDAANATIELEALVPILVETATGLVTSATEGMIGVSSSNRLYTVTIEGLCTELTSDIDFGVRPVALRELASGELLVAAVADSLTDLVMFHSALGEVTMALDGATPKVVGLEVVRDTHTGASLFHFLASVKTAGDSYVTSWTPHEVAGDEIQLFSTRMTSGIGAVNGIPVAASPYIVVPGTRGAALVAPFDPSLRKTFAEALATAVITSPTTDQLVIDDRLAIPFDDGGVPNYRLEQVTVAGVEHGGETLHAFDGETIDFPMFVYRAATPASQGTVDLTALDTLLIDANDPEPNFADVLLIETDASTNLYAVVDFDPVTHLVTLDPPLDSTDDTVPVDYWRPEPTEARLRPLLRLTPATTGNWAAEILDRTSLVFPGAEPVLQSGTAFKTDNDGHPELVVLGAHWTTHPPELPGPVVEFIVDGAMGAWRPQLVDSSSNPELSWEYWNGKGWWRLDVTTDLTRNLKTTGAVRFKVPSDLASSDWAGRTNHWIRARLIGGDYGREKVTVTSKPLPAGASEQTIERSSEGIRAPSVLKLHISYAICEGVRPMFVLAEDSGSVRDQSDANRTAGAVVEAFVPLDVMLGRLTNSPVASDAAAARPPECGCGCGGGMTAGQPATASATVPGTTSRRFSGRAVFIGVDAVLSEAPVNVLLLVDEHDLSAFAPMSVEALVADRFVPVVANDSTRALGESGVLSMAFAVQPTRRELFGSALTWLRLTPVTQAATTGNWIPTVRGAYLNAAWASATETLTRELLGSSDGAPSLRVTLARPPVLHKTLELRVKEPLSDEERAELRARNPQRVLTEVEGLPGDWVLWDQVIDPGDEAPGARVYAFDEGSGEVRFGDGLHGMIPPIGRESIVAFTYKRTEPGPAGSDTVPANGIAARTALNLVSPVESVEAVFAADRAAGGAPPEPDDRVLRFGFARVRHRNRAVTLQDLEDLALQSSPDIVQAHAVRRSDSIRLVVVMRGEHPSPTAPQVRELRRVLLAQSPVALSARDALRIAGPRVRRLRIELVLRVETLDVAGAVGAEVKQRLARFFDTATGSVDGGGWRLGVNPGDEDIAFALIDLPHLDSILYVSLREVADDGAERAWPQSIDPAELVLLDEDPIRLRFETAEVLA